MAEVWALSAAVCAAAVVVSNDDDTFVKLLETVLAEVWALSAAVCAAAVVVSNDDDTEVNEPLISSAICAEPLINPSGKTVEPLISDAICAELLTTPSGNGTAGLDAPIVIVPTTSRLPVEALNFMWLPDALPSKKLPAPSTKNPCPLLKAVGSVEPNAICGVVEVESILILLVPVVKIFNLAAFNSTPSPELLRYSFVPDWKLKNPLPLKIIPLLEKSVGGDAPIEILCTPLLNIISPFAVLRLKSSVPIAIEPPSTVIKFVESPNNLKAPPLSM